MIEMKNRSIMGLHYFFSGEIADVKVRKIRRDYPDVLNNGLVLKIGTIPGRTKANTYTSKQFSNVKINRGK